MYYCSAALAVGLFGYHGVLRGIALRFVPKLYGADLEPILHFLQIFTDIISPIDNLRPTDINNIIPFILIACDGLITPPEESYRVWCV
jgi:hypothetical protein